MRAHLPASRLTVGLGVVLLAGCATGAAPWPSSASATPVVTASPTSTSTSSTPPTVTPRGAESAATASPTPVAPTPDCLADPALRAFASGLLADLASLDRQRIAARIAGRFDFVVAFTDVGMPPMSADVAAHALIDGLNEPFVGYRPLLPGSTIACDPAVTPETYAPGNDILKGMYTAAFLTRGWGTSGQDQAFVYLARLPDGSPTWRGVWYALNGFLNR